ncbi:MAG: DNA topoisomerase IB [Novosphingobium sp.]
MARLTFIDADAPGYTRHKIAEKARPGGSRASVANIWEYRDDKGEIVRSRAIINRLNRIALPPAYHDAWFARDPNAHIQATGIDEKGRKQYRYHADFVVQRTESKYAACAEFGKALPKVRAQVEIDLARRDLSRERVVAAIIRLLDLGSVRIGNESYAKANSSFGATTLREHHAKVRGTKLMLNYVGKSGKVHELSIADARLARVVRRCQDLPGGNLFQFVGDDGAVHAVSSTDVNDCLRRHAGEFTAKDFRTWSASVIAFDYLANTPDKPSLKAMLERVSRQLGNTPAIARKSYVHPAMIDAVQAGREVKRPLPRATRYLSRAERGLLAHLDALASNSEA